MPYPQISIIIPTKNEGETLSDVLKNISPMDAEIFVIDGNSDDNTEQIARSYNVRFEKDNGKGKGSAIRQGIDRAHGNILVFIDADGSHNVSDIPDLIAPITRGEADMVIGSRMLGGSDELSGNLTNFIRNFGSSLLTVILNYRFKSRLTDIENGFRAIKKPIAQNLKLRTNSFIIEQEMVIKALKKGTRIVEIASHEFKRKGGKSKLPTWHGWKFVIHFFWELFT